MEPVIKKFILFILLLVSFSSFAAVINQESIRGFFPKSDSLPGGAELWLSTGVKTKEGGNYTVYTATYSFYSGKKEKLMDIERRQQYKTDVAVYSYNNFVDASDMFRQLTINVPKNRSQMVRFGDRGVFFLFPKSGNINDADFYLVFITKTFVVWIHSDDGFAIMDVGNGVNDSINRFVAQNAKLYMTKSLHLQADAEGFEGQTKTLSFTTDFPSAIKLSGRVFDKQMRPLGGVKLTVLETGGSFLTDKSGRFSKTIKLDGIKELELSANFYLESNLRNPAKDLEGGLFESVLGSEDGERTQIWKLENISGNVSGTAYVKTSSGYSGYPVKGKAADGGRISLSLDCSRTGIDFKCVQNFDGQLKDGKISGKWTGTGGGGDFLADMSGYKQIKRKIIAAKDVADIKTVAVCNSGTANPASAFLNISSGEKCSNFIYVNPDMKRLGINNIFTTGVKFVLTHLPKGQTGGMSVFMYDADEKSVKINLSGGKYSGQVSSSEEPYRAEFDVSGLKGAFALGAVSGRAGTHYFSGTAEPYDTLKPYFEITEYADTNSRKTLEKPFSLSASYKTGGDFLGDKNTPGKDGLDDICYDGVFNYPEGRLTSFQIEINGKVRRIYNTNPVDIYPAVGFIKNSKLLNKKDGSLDITLGEKPEKFSICINGSRKPEKGERISYKYMMDSNIYEGLAE